MTVGFVSRRGGVLRRAVRVGLAGGLALAVTAGAPLAASAAPTLPTGTAGSITPGALIDGICTANFIYTDGDRAFIGYSAHCAADITDPSSDPDVCFQDTAAMGTPVRIEGAGNPGTLVYSSWTAMRDNGVGSGELCQFNDFALAEISPDDLANVDPTVPLVGGPTALATAGVEPGDEAVSYQPNITSPAVKQGMVTQVLGDGLAYTVLTDPASIGGDSGSGFLDGDGAAFGVLSAANGGSLVTDLAMALDYVADNSELGALSLVTGGDSFSTDGVDMTPVPAGVGVPGLGGLLVP